MNDVKKTIYQVMTLNILGLALIVLLYSYCLEQRAVLIVIWESKTLLLIAFLLLICVKSLERKFFKAYFGILFITMILVFSIVLPYAFDELKILDYANIDVPLIFYFALNVFKVLGVIFLFFYWFATPYCLLQRAKDIAWLRDEKQ